ncbi:MAG: MFS transporter [Clostridiales bacterium]|jgi:oligogalacturonide transporter|nr:MFS transporter [Clostridiales bacterium]
MKKEKKGELLHMAAYGAADAAAGGANQIIGLYYFLFLTVVAGLGPLAAGVVTGIGRVWDGLIDPAMGIVVDRTRKKRGSVRFLMTIAVIPIAVAFFLLWNTSIIESGGVKSLLQLLGISGDVGKTVYFCFAYILWTTSYSLAVVPYDSLLPKIVPEYKTRTNYTVSRMIFSGIGGVSATYIYGWLIRVSEENPLSPAFTDDFAVMSLVFGLIFAVFVLLTALFVKEPSGLSKPAPERISLKVVFKSYADVLRCRTYRKFFGLVLSGAFISSAVLTAMMMFVMLIYGDIESFIFTLSLSFLVVNVKGAIEIGFFVPNTIFMKKYNKHRPYFIDIPMLVAAAVIILFTGPDTPIWLFFVAMGLMGGGVSCLGFVPMALLPDLADAQELISGKRSEGVNAGLNTFGKQVVGGVATFIFGLILTLFGIGSTENLSPLTATPEKIWAVKIMFAVIPMLVCGLILWISSSYKLDGKAHALIKRLVAERRQDGSVNVSKDEKAVVEEITGIAFDKMWIGGKDC